MLGCSDRRFDLVDLTENLLCLGINGSIFLRCGSRLTRLIIQWDVNIDPLPLFTLLFLAFAAVFNKFDSLGGNVINDDRRRFRTLLPLFIRFPVPLGAILEGPDQTQDRDLHGCQQSQQSTGHHHNIGKNRAQCGTGQLANQTADQAATATGNTTVVQIADQLTGNLKIQGQMADAAAEQHKAYKANGSHDHRALGAEGVDNE